MEPISLRALVGALGEGRACHGDAILTDVTIDSRRVGEGTLFVALPGRRVDGHDFVGEAREAGAAAALVAREVSDPLAQWIVPDPAATLARLGAWVRAQAQASVIGVTGSNGKTTVKEMLAEILAEGGDTLATHGNHNNALGVPLTLCRLNSGHRFAVVEMGANAPGEIAALTRLARPRIGVVTNAAAAHLSGFGDIGGVARAKGELFAGLPTDGVAVINADDEHAPLWRKIAGSRVVTFGSSAADVRLLSGAGSELVLALPGDDVIRVNLPLPGVHNRVNAAAAVATALAAGASPTLIARGLARIRPVAGRSVLQRLPKGGELIDDSYNANPASLRAAIDLLSASGGGWLVLGEMGELGESAAALHADAGAYARHAGVTRLFTCGGSVVRAAADAFGGGARHFDTREALLEALRSAMQAETRVLVKGSRSAAMDEIVAALLDDDSSGAKR